MSVNAFRGQAEMKMQGSRKVLHLRSSGLVENWRVHAISKGIQKAL